MDGSVIVENKVNIGKRIYQMRIVLLEKVKTYGGVNT